LVFYNKSKNLILDDVTVTINGGHIYGLLGINGAGKTSLLQCLLGYKFPRTGTCLFQNYNVFRRPYQVLKRTFYVPDESELMSAISTNTITDLKILAQFYPQFSEIQFLSNLKALDISIKKTFKWTSSGERKKIIIAFGLATNVELLVLDEPTNKLDSASTAQFNKLIAASIAPEKAIIIATNQIDNLEGLIDILLVIHKKKIAIDLTLDQISKRFFFGTHTNSATYRELYKEEGLSQDYVISSNPNQQDTNVNISLFFNAILQQTEKITEELKKRNDGLNY